MRKIIAGLNVTLDGYCDHTSVVADEDLHHHYAELLKEADTILYGRVTYQLMEYWRDVVKNPTGEKDTDEFARVMDHIHKVVFSHTLQNVDWHSATLAHQTLQQKVVALKQQTGGDILVGSRSLINQLLQLGLLDELQLCVHPVRAGKGLLLFDEAEASVQFTLNKTKVLGSGAVVLYYEVKK